MSTGGKQQIPTSKQQRDLINEQKQLEGALEQQQMSGLDESQELDSEKAVMLQPNLGNQAVQDLMSRLKNVNDTLVELEQEGSELEEEQQEEVDLEEELTGQSFGGGSGGDSSSSGNPWENEYFYGGDDDASPQKRKRKKRRKRFSFLQNTEPEEEKKQAAPKADLFSEIIPTPAQGSRSKDSIYQAVEICLEDAHNMFGQSLDPQDLLKRKGYSDPIRCPIEIGRFLAPNAQSPIARSLSEVTAEPAAPLLTPQGGFSTAIARLATLAICSEASEGGEEQTDRAVALSLRHDAWKKTVVAARQLAQRGQLHAPKICEVALNKPSQEEKSGLPTPSPLGGAGLKHVMPHPPAIGRPYLAIPPKEEESKDELVQLLDDALATFIDGKAPEKDLVHYVDYPTLQPALNSANALLGALGRTQVEFAAAAVAVKSIYRGAPTTSPLKHGDFALRQLAQAVVKAGRALEKLRGLELEKAESQATSSIKILSETTKALQSLRIWGFSTIAGALEKRSA